MWDIFHYPFFRNALAGVLIISIASAIIGTYIVTRRLVSISGGVTHACFGGLGLGYYLGINPVFSAAIFAIISSLGVEVMTRTQRMRDDSAIAVIWAFGMALGVFFVFLTPGYVPELNTFLFGNVLTIAPSDLWAFAIFTIVLVTFTAIFFRRIVAIAFDPDFARIVGMPVIFISISMTVLTAVCIVLAIRLVGIMMLMSMLSIPQITSELFYHRFRPIMICSIVVSVLTCVAGLMLSTAIDVPCSALIVMIMVALYIAIRLIRFICEITGRWVRSRSNTAAILIAVISASSLAALPSCSLKKNTAASRNYTAFITRYNIYFNGDEHYRETIKKMEDEYEDDYSQILYMHPAEALNDEKATKPTGDFKRSIEKAQKAIQLRSIKKRPQRKAGKGSDPEYKKWLQREEYNPFLHNAWMMMARSQYLNGDFLGAAATFYYISKHFWWLPTTVTEAKLWQARCYVAIDWLFEAESILTKIKPDEIEGNSTLEGLYYFAYADLNIRSHHENEAIPLLVKAISYAKGSQKIRLTFLLGQLYEATGQKELAYTTFKKVGGMSGASYRTKFNARIKQSEVFQGSDIRSEVKALNSMARFRANADYLDQIYYAIGNLYLSRADTTKAIENYRLAVEKSKRNGIDKALAQITLGKLYYGMHEYEKAQPCYAEAVPALPDNYPDLQQLRRRSDVLDELAVYSQNVTLQDSLLRLSAMSPEEQRKVVDKIIDDLKKREQEEAEQAAREKYLAEQAANGTGLQQGSTSAPTTFTLNTDKSWYFYNEATRNAGRTEFQKRWGSRKLEDDWRRRNKASFSLTEDDHDGEEDPDNPDNAEGGSEGDGNENPESSAAREAAEHAADPHYPEYYLKQIPKTDAERATANEIIQEGLYNMGVILKDKLDDNAGAEHEFTQLLTRYPDNTYRLDTYYNLYLMYARAGQTDRAELYRQLIMTEFPDSRQGEALADPLYMEKLIRMPQVEQQYYDQIYEAYLNNDNRKVHEIYDLVRRDYPMSRIMPKFMFVEALSYVTENNPEKFDEVLSQLVSLYPETDVSPIASSYISLLRQGRKFNSSGGNVRGMVWSARLSNGSEESATLDTPAEFDFQTDGPQVLLLIYRTDLINANRLLFDVARHNFSTFNVRDFDLEQLQFGNLGLLVVSGFDNRSQVIDYRNKLESGGDFRIPKGVVPLIISRHNFDILLNEGRTLEEYFDAAGDKRLDQIHTATLPADEYPTAKEMYTPDAGQPSQTPVETPAPSAPQPRPQPKPQEQPQTKPQVEPEKQPETAPQPEPQPEPVTEPVSEPLPEPEPEVKPEPLPQPEPEINQEPEPEPSEDPDFYDIPVPPLPTVKPPVAPKVK